MQRNRRTRSKHMHTPSHVNRRPPIGGWAVASYSAGSIGTGVFSTVPTVLLLYYCTEILHISPAWAATAVLLPKLWSIVWDPLVGAWSDRTRSRFGRRRPFMVAGAAGVALCFVALFAPPPGLTTAMTCAWVAAAYFMMATAYSLFAVPYIALPAELTDCDKLRSDMVSARMVVAMLGVLLGAGGAPLIVASFGGGRGGYAWMAIIVATCCALAMTPPIRMLRTRDCPSPLAGSPGNLLAALKRAVRNRSFCWLATSYLLQITATAAVSAAAPYLITRVLHRGGGDVGLALGATIMMTAFSVPIWSRLGQRFGERPVLAVAAMLYAATAAGVGLAAGHEASWPIVLLAFGLVGVPFAGLQVLPFTLLAHTAHAAGHDDEVSAEGALTGLWTAAEKLGLGLGPAAVGVALSVNGGRTESLPELMLAVPAVLMLLSLPLVLRSAGSSL